MKYLIVLNGVNETTLSITTQAHALKQSALATARAIGDAIDADTQAPAAAAISDIKGILKKLETSKHEVKAPVIALGKRIDAIAADFAKELAQEATRLNNGIQSYFRREQERAAMEQRMANALAEKRRKNAEIEAQAVAEELRLAEQAALDAPTQAQAAQLDAQARALATQAEAAQAKVEAVEAPEIIAPQRAEKMTVRKTWKHRLTDIALLYKSRPELVSLEPLTNAINAEVRGGMRECPGLEIWEETDVSVRA
jgi:hypothetical protein